MTVVSNTSPINYLVLIGAADVLHQLFDLIWIPDRVRRELSDPNAPTLVRSWITDPPDWLHVTGTLGVLSEAGTRGLIEIPDVVDRLHRTTFRAKPSLFKWLLDQHGGPTSS